MKLDSVTVGIMTKMAEKHGIPTERVMDIVKAYYASIQHVGKVSNSGVLIHMKNIGKLVYSDKTRRRSKEATGQLSTTKGIMKLMYINPETKLPQPTAESLLIPEFLEIWQRVHKIDGDRTGTKKTRNLQELGYVYFHGVYDSRFKFITDPIERKRR